MLYPRCERLSRIIPRKPLRFANRRQILLAALARLSIPQSFALRHGRSLANTSTQVSFKLCPGCVCRLLCKHQTPDVKAWIFKLTGAAANPTAAAFCLGCWGNPGALGRLRGTQPIPSPPSLPRVKSPTCRACDPQREGLSGSNGSAFWILFSAWV